MRMERRYLKKLRELQLVREARWCRMVRLVIIPVDLGLVLKLELPGLV